MLILVRVVLASFLLVAGLSVTDTVKITDLVSSSLFDPHTSTPASSVPSVGVMTLLPPNSHFCELQPQSSGSLTGRPGVSTLESFQCFCGPYDLRACAVRQV